jgi:hypothetical protein
MYLPYSLLCQPNAIARLVASSTVAFVLIVPIFDATVLTLLMFVATVPIVFEPLKSEAMVLILELAAATVFIFA